MGSASKGAASGGGERTAQRRQEEWVGKRLEIPTGRKERGQGDVGVWERGWLSCGSLTSMGRDPVPKDLEAGLGFEPRWRLGWE